MPQKIDIKHLNFDWSAYSKKVPWDYITTRDLSKILNLSLQTVHNYIGRSVLPKPVNSSAFDGLGNKNWFCIADLKAANLGTTKDQIIKTWIAQNLSSSGVQNEAQARYLISVAYDVLGFDKPIEK